MDVIAISISVNYADILKYIINNDAQFFLTWIIVTDPEDKETIDVINNSGLKNIECLFYDKFRVGAVFNKGGAIKMAQEYVIKKYKSVNRNNTAILLLDSDIYLPDNFKTTLSNMSLCDDTLYGISERHDYYTLYDFTTRTNRHVHPHGDYFIGYFQMYKFSEKYLYKNSHNASHCDLEFKDLFPNKIAIDTAVFHLGKPMTNWNGRVIENDNINTTNLIKCKTDNCLYVIHSDIRNNGGEYCCYACMKFKCHGGWCEKKDYK